MSRLNQVYASTQNINNTLIKEAHNKKEEILHGDTEKLSIWNLDKAPNWILFVAIFHSTPNNLRIPRSFKISLATQHLDTEDEVFVTWLLIELFHQK